MQTGKRKREVSSCIPCYTKKQKCDRQYPCNRCTRRRRPEECIYCPEARTPNLELQPGKSRDEGTQNGVNHLEHLGEDEHFDFFSTLTMSGISQEKPESSLAEVFGYYGQSESNTMALVRKLVHESDGPDAKDIIVPDEVATEVRKTLDKMLDRPILDFLIRYFAIKINWIDQLLYLPWFLEQYQRWWSLDRLSSVADIEFPILFLRICIYASQFLPSPTYNLDRIKGVALTDIRKSCEDIIVELAPICSRLDPRGSLIRLQHIALAGLASISMGHTNGFWEALSCATRVAQQIGLHLDTIVWDSNVDEIQKEMTRRTFCNLYIWDCCLSKRLDRIPFLPDCLSADVMPRMNLLTPGLPNGSDAPDLFTARVLRAQLAQFWRTHSPDQSSSYDAIVSEERYELFCTDFLQNMPPAFALQPDKKWDECLPSLPIQRQLLHMAIFEHLCWNFRPTLVQKPEQVKTLPVYKQILQSHNKRLLAVAALKLLESVLSLHGMMKSSYAQYGAAIAPIFEAAVPLICLCADESFPGECSEDRSHTMKADPLGVDVQDVTRDKCMQAARSALCQLQNLSAISQMAQVGAQTLSRLIQKVDGTISFTQVCGGQLSAPSELIPQGPETWNCDQSRENTMGCSEMDVPFDNAGCIAAGVNWSAEFDNIAGNFDFEGVGFFVPGHL